MSEKKYIGFDLGAESGRCVVAVQKDDKLELNEVHRFVTHNYNNGKEIHWDVEGIFNEIITGLKEAYNNFGSDYESIGVDTWGVDYALIDENNNLINDPFHYRDDRTDNIMEAAFKVVPKEKFYNYTGSQFQQYNTVFQLLAEIKSNPDKLTKAKKMILMPDYLNYLLSGEINAEYTIASTTGLIDPSIRDWNKELIDLLNIPNHIFPEVVEPGTKLGNILPEIAKKTKLNPEIPVIATACHDTASAVASIPASKGNWAFLSSGTWSLMGIEISSPVLDKAAMDFNFTNEGGVQNTIRLLKNILGLWPVQESRRYWQKHGKQYTYQNLMDKAIEAPSSKRWLNLNDPRFLKSGEMPEKINKFLIETNQEEIHDDGLIIRTILENLAFSYKKAIEEVEKISGEKIEKLHAVGGGIQNELLSQLTADAIGMDVIAGPIEGTIVGNIGVQAIATGAVDNIYEWRRIVRKSFLPKTYKPQNSEYFEANRTIFDRN